jgi:3-deoxy-D-manno-octulosonate 8-phosphate phosphatase (KDO 8-P phosphatase)
MVDFKNLRLLLFDVDGVMTDGGIYYDSTGCEQKKFNVKDGQICSVLKKEGYKLGIITGRNSSIVDKRFNELGFDFIFQGVNNKVNTFKEILKLSGFNANQTVYVGDDINDIKLFELVGFSSCPNDAEDYIKDKVMFVAKSNGGKGVLREIADLILRKTRNFDKIIMEY